jgi:hypothetical protein
MTREEAIEHGKEQLEVFGGTHRTFIEMAIKALEQLPKLQNRCHALTHGQVCVFCPYECEHRTEMRAEDGNK